MTTVAYVVNTEYHLLVTASLIFEGPWSGEEVEHVIIEAGPTDGARFKGVKNRSAIGVEYQCWNVNSLGRGLDFDLKTSVLSLLRRRIDVLVIFLEAHPLNIYLTKKLGRRGVNIILAPDGVRPYYELNFKKWAMLKSKIKKTLQTYYNLAVEGLWPNFLYIPRKGYGSLTGINALYASFPTKVKNRSNKKVIKISICQTATTQRALCRLFDFDIDRDLPKRERIIFYVNNLLFREATYKEELTVIFYLQKLNPGGLYIKLHPQTPLEHVKELEDMGVKTIDDSVPAELYIASLKNCIVIGGWSNALTLPNPQCAFYWLTEYFRASGCMYESIRLENPCDYINEPEALEAIRFPADE